MICHKLNRCSLLSILTPLLPIKATILTRCENCSQPNRSRWSSLPAAIASNHGAMTESATENATSSNVSSTKSSGIDAFSLAMKDSHDDSWLSCILPLHSSGSNELSTSPKTWTLFTFGLHGQKFDLETFAEFISRLNIICHGL